MYLTDLDHRFSRIKNPEGVRRCSQPVDVGSDGQVLVPEALRELSVLVGQVYAGPVGAKST